MRTKKTRHSFCPCALYHAPCMEEKSKTKFLGTRHLFIATYLDTYVHLISHKYTIYIYIYIYNFRKILKKFRNLLFYYIPV